jgi:hypothetical protein
MRVPSSISNLRRISTGTTTWPLALTVAYSIVLVKPLPPSFTFHQLVMLLTRRWISIGIVITLYSSWKQSPGAQKERRRLSRAQAKRTCLRPG